MDEEPRRRLFSDFVAEVEANATPEELALLEEYREFYRREAERLEKEGE